MSIYRTVAALALTLLLAAPATAQTTADTTAVLSDRQLRQRLGYQITQLQNALAALNASLDHARISRDAVHARIVRDSLRAVTPLPPVVVPPAPPPPAPDTVVAPPPAPEPPPIIEPPGPLPVGAAFILGPQVASGESPWPWFDANAIASGLKHGRAYPAVIVDPANPTGPYLVQGAVAYNRNYYDVAMALYIEHARSGNDEHQQNARKIADAFHGMLVEEQRRFGGTAPRNMSLGGLILRALDGRPDMWPYITTETRRQYHGWLGLRLNRETIYLGVRDGAYTLMYTAWLAHVHPEAAVRAEFRQKALDAAVTYYARLQRPDGGWYWRDDLVRGGQEDFAQPFMVGLLLEALIYVHQLTGDERVGQSIVRAVPWLHGYYAQLQDAPVPVPVPTQPGHAGWNVKWRNMPYLVFPDGTWAGSTTLAGGWDLNTLREARQANSTVVHAYGYAYVLTGDERFREWGDEVFAATFGNGQGPGADAYRNLADYQEKEYGQAYRSAGRYLYWRQAR